MMGLLLKDLFCMRKTVGSMVFVLLVWCVVFLPGGSIEFIIYMMGMLWMLMLINAVGFDQQCKWDCYALSMPLTRADMIKARYVFGLLFCAAGGLLSLLIGVVGVKFFSILFAEILAGVCGSLIIALFFISVLLPAIYRFGVERSRIIMIALFVLFYGGLMLFAHFFGTEGIVKVLSGMSMPMFLCGGLLFAAACYLLSFRISLAIYMKKEF